MRQKPERRRQRLANRKSSIGGTGGTVTNSSATASTLFVGGGPSDTSTASYAGTIANGTGTVAITKEGSGTQTLTGANTYTGATTVSGGKLEAAAANALGGTSNVTINTGGTLLLSNTGTTNRINDSATVTMSGGTIAFSGNVIEGSSPGTGTLTLTANSIINFAGGNVVINFGDSHLASWTGGTTLSIYNWDGLVTGGGNDRLIFSATARRSPRGSLGRSVSTAAREAVFWEPRPSWVPAKSSPCQSPARSG